MWQFPELTSADPEDLRRQRDRLVETPGLACHYPQPPFTISGQSGQSRKAVRAMGISAACTDPDNPRTITNIHPRLFIFDIVVDL